MSGICNCEGLTLKPAGVSVVACGVTAVIVLVSDVTGPKPNPLPPAVLSLSNPLSVFLCPSFFIFVLLCVSEMAVASSVRLESVFCVLIRSDVVVRNCLQTNSVCVCVCS